MDYQYKNENKEINIEHNKDKKDEIKDFRDKKRVIAYASKLSKINNSSKK